MSEYSAARDAGAVVRRSDRAFTRVHGRDPLRMIQGLVTNDVAGAAPDRAVYAAVLTAKGRMVADTRIIRREGELLLETDAAAAPLMAAHLRKFVPPLFARFEDATDRWSVTGVHGPEAARFVGDVFGVQAQAGAGGPAEDVLLSGTLGTEPVTIVTTSYTGDAGFDILSESGEQADAVMAALEAAGARPIGLDTLDVLRIEAGRPRWGRELDETTIPLEAGLRERAISERKGCYTGQEVIVRILHRGHVNWQLRGLLLGDAAVPDDGATLVRAGDGKTVARVTSATRSPRHRQTIALGYVRREVEPSATLHLGDADGSEATVVELPFPEVE